MMHGGNRHRRRLHLAVRREHLVDRAEGLAAEFTRHGVGALHIGVNHAEQVNAFALLLEFPVDAGVIASENAYAHHGDIDYILRWQKRFLAGRLPERIVNGNEPKGIWISQQEPDSEHRKDWFAKMRTIALLTVSNIFMTIAWYGHLRYREVPLYKVIVVSWLIAFLEYCFQVPANRIGSYEFTAAQLKTIQEVITLTVFAVFSVVYLRQPLRWNYLAGFALIVAAVAVIFKKW